MPMRIDCRVSELGGDSFLEGSALRPSRFPLLLLRHLEATSSVPSDSTGERQSCSSFTADFTVSKVPPLGP
jgi:hypothetical protein